jgi:predicted CXXCH cytochrome family protein
MQFNEWNLSAHASALETLRRSDQADADCLQCHSADDRFSRLLIELHDEGEREGDPPAPATLEGAKWGVACTSCHNPHGGTEQVAQLIDDSYTVCTTCHSDSPAAPDIHHPVREMFEGVSLVEGIDGVVGAHFAAEEGPRCTSCHMPDVPIQEGGNRNSHMMKLILPAETEAGQTSSCGMCHTDLTATDLQSLISDTQEAVRARLTTARSRLESAPEPEADMDAYVQYQQATNALTFIQNDGSMGIHNYAYTDHLLKFVEEATIGLGAPRASFQPTEAPAPTAAPPVTQLDTRTDSIQVESGIRPITILIIVAIVIFLTLSAFAFFRTKETQGA